MIDSPQDIALRIFHEFYPVMAVPIESYGTGRAQLCLPIISPEDAKAIINEAERLFRSEKNILALSSKTIIVGDLHGHILDLFRIIRHFKTQISHTFLFLGDIVDRGEFSFETVMLIFVLKVLNPNRVMIIRGNHEFSDTFLYSGFSHELTSIGMSDLIPCFASAFSNLPIAAILNKTMLCVHGGIGPSVEGLGDIVSVDRPFDNFSNPSLVELMWSDPTTHVATFFPSPRGSGSLFGTQAIRTFLEKSKLKALVRGHQCVMEGFVASNDNLVYTVFSASNYCGRTGNKAAVGVFDPQTNKILPETFEALDYLHRSQVQFSSLASSARSDHSPNHVHTRSSTRASYKLRGTKSDVVLPRLITNSPPSGKQSSPLLVAEKRRIAHRSIPVVSLDFEQMIAPSVLLKSPIIN